jgi:hypothetical protein
LPRARPIPAFWAPDIPLYSPRDRRLHYSPINHTASFRHDGTPSPSHTPCANHGAHLPPPGAPVPQTDGHLVVALAGSE